MARTSKNPFTRMTEANRTFRKAAAEMGKMAAAAEDANQAFRLLKKLARNVKDADEAGALEPTPENIYQVQRVERTLKEVFDYLDKK